MALAAVGNGAGVVLRHHIFAQHSHIAEGNILHRYEGYTAILVKVVEQLAFAFGNTLLAAKTLKMGIADVGNNAVVWLTDRTEQLNLLLSTCTHLDNSKLCVAGHCKQCQRHADMVVQITSGGVYLKLLGKYSADKLLCCGLAVTAHNADNRYGKLSAVLCRK